MDDDDWANSAEMDALMAAAEAKPPPPPRTVSTKQLQAVLKDTWGYAEFRAGQEEAVERACAGCDVAVYWPTGSGKSLVYQVPALLHETGCVLVISPLVSLMMDQCKALNAKKGMDVACFLGSAQLICLGSLGEYVGRIHNEVKRRPSYIVDEIDVQS